MQARFVLALLLASSFAQLPAQTAVTNGEARASHALEAARKLGPPELYAFLQPMPKGADLHMHLSGAIYAETFLAEAVEQKLCVDPVALKLVAAVANGCPSGDVPAATVLTDQHLYDALVDSFSMRSFVPHAGTSGHDQFFDTFERFGAVKDAGAWLDEVATRAAAQNEQYLEIMQTPPFGTAIALAKKIGWPAGAEKTITREQLAKLRDEYLAAGLRNDVAADERAFADAKAAQDVIEFCKSDPPGIPARVPGSAGDGRGCFVQIHWLYQILRANSPAQVFAQTLLGFEVASADPDVVGINFVQPEDARLAMGDYHLQMEMLDYLHSVYPKVKISLHAGELAPGLVPPDGLSFHIREAVDLGHASRIGHGVDVLYEKDSPALLKELASQHVMVEINLTSNDGILGVKGSEHPLHAYMAAHVPVALSTDDEGVSRIDLTHEYVKGAEEQNLTYLDLKRMARTSLEHAFFAGEGLWAAPDEFTRRKPVCAAAITPNSKPGPSCDAFLKDNERAREQYELERRFAVFEAAVR